MLLPQLVAAQVQLPGVTTPAGERQRATEHPDGIVDLSVGTPVDPTPRVVREALTAAADAPGYPTTQGTQRLRTSVVDWFARRRGVPGLSTEQVLPTIGSKELVAYLPALLGLGAGDVVVDGGGDADSAFFTRRIRIEGDTAAVVALHNTLEAGELTLADLLGLPAALGRPVNAGLTRGLARLRPRGAAA